MTHPHQESILAPGVVVHTFSGEENSHLIILDGESALIDCHCQGLAAQIRTRGLPFPAGIFHTRVLRSTFREGAEFTPCPTWVNETERLLVEKPDWVQSAIATQTADLAGWSTQLGAEPYGIAGWQTRFPLYERPDCLHFFQTGEVFPLGRGYLETVPLPVFGPGAVGFLLRDGGGAPRAFFCGDLLHAGPFVREFYSLERNYGGSRLAEYPPLLVETAGFGSIPWFPTHGPPAPDGAACALTLGQKIKTHLEALVWNPYPPPAPRTEPPAFGRYRKHGEGLYQINNFGNVILLIRTDGHGLMVDPGPCDFENPARESDFICDLALFEREAGLKTIDWILLTHFHGDHIDCTDLVRGRYPGCRVAAWGPVAEVVEHPERYPYCARLPWYGLDRKSVGVDCRLNLHTPLNWRGTRIQTLHLPGHALIHAGYLLEFKERRIALTGDSVQSNGEAAGLHALIGNHSVPDENAGCLACFRTLSHYPIDLNLGGHGSWFDHPAPVYQASISRMEHALPSLRALVADGDLARAFVPPHFPKWSPRDLA